MVCTFIWKSLWALKWSPAASNTALAGSNSLPRPYSLNIYSLAVSGEPRSLIRAGFCWIYISECVCSILKSLTWCMYEAILTGLYLWSAGFAAGSIFLCWAWMAPWHHRQAVSPRRWSCSLAPAAPTAVRSMVLWRVVPGWNCRRQLWVSVCIPVTLFSSQTLLRTLSVSSLYLKGHSGPLRYCSMACVLMFPRICCMMLTAKVAICLKTRYFSFRMSRSNLMRSYFFSACIFFSSMTFFMKRPATTASGMGYVGWQRPRRLGPLSLDPYFIIMITTIARIF